MFLKLVHSKTETLDSKKKMLRCGLPSAHSPRNLSVLSAPSHLDRLRARSPELAAVADQIIATFLEESE
jgi:hypothetical protein